MDATFLISLVAIIWADLLLSGDNAIVIAMACRELPPSKRNLGMALGAGGAVIARIVAACFAAALTRLPCVDFVGAILLMWIATKLIIDEDGEDGKVPSAPTKLLGAILIITVADMSMSIDNIIAVVGLAHGNMILIALGVIVSIPIVICGAKLISSIIDRAPWLKWAGGALLGWIAGGMMVKDPIWNPAAPAEVIYIFSAIGAFAVVMICRIFKIPVTL